MRLISRFIIISFIVFGSFISLCATEQSLESGIDVTFQFLDRQESRNTFKTRRVYKYAQPAYLRISNNTSRSLPFSRDSISKSTFSHGELFELCEYNPLARATTWTITGLFVAWPICLPGAVIDGLCANKNNGYMKSRFRLAEIVERYCQKLWI